MKHKSMSQMNKERGRKWDGKSRPSTKLYKKRWNGPGSRPARSP